MAGKLYKIEPNTVQETLIIPLYGKKVCSELYPEFFTDETALKLFNKIDYDWSRIKNNFMTRFGIVEAGMRTLDMVSETKEYLGVHPGAAVVNLGCGLDDLFMRVDNGKNRCVNLDRADVIEIRTELMPPGDREINLSVDLNDPVWMDEIGYKEEEGAIFIACGVFYYFTFEDMEKLLKAMSVHFPGSRLIFDTGNRRALKLMLKNWVHGSGMHLDAFFYVDDLVILRQWLGGAQISSKGYMTGYRKLDRRMPWLYRRLAEIADSLYGTRIVRIEF